MNKRMISHVSSKSYKRKNKYKRNLTRIIIALVTKLKLEKLTKHRKP